eukprot:2639070-Rhodomonas_salina.1
MRSNVCGPKPNARCTSTAVFCLLCLHACRSTSASKRARAREIKRIQPSSPQHLYQECGITHLISACRPSLSASLPPSLPCPLPCPLPYPLSLAPSALGPNTRVLTAR